MSNIPLTSLFSIFSNKFKDAFEKKMVEIDLHSGQFFILQALWQSDDQSQADLVKTLNVSPPTIFNMVSKLVDAGLIDTKKDTNDARITRVSLTQKGFDIRQLAEKQFADFENQVFDVLTETEKMMLSLLLQKLTERILH